MKKPLKIILRITIDLFIAIVFLVLLTQFYWKVSEEKEYKKALNNIQKIGGIKVEDIDLIVIKEGSNYYPKTLILSKEQNRDQYLFVLEEIAEILKRKPDFCGEPSIKCPPDYTIILKSNDGSPIREFEIDSIGLVDIKNTKVRYPFYMALRIREWFDKIPNEPAKDKPLDGK